MTTPISRNEPPNASPMVWKDEWENADPEELGEQYVAWVHQLTEQGLHSKADIATVLAILSNRIKALSSLVSETGTRLDTQLARENYEPPEGWQLKCEKCGADTTGPCGWPSDCPTGLGKHWIGR